jgi:hypothetical protein
MKQTNKLDVWMVSRISAFTGQSIGSTQGNLVVWYLNDAHSNHYEIHLDFHKKELGFLDWCGDDKTYYSLVGVAMMAEFTTEDYFTDLK